MTNARHNGCAFDGWQCFHCGEIMTTVGGARDHFGATPDKKPACQIKVGEERGLVMALRRAEEEIDVLRAQAERLLEIINYYQQGQVASDDAMSELIARSENTPAQCLAEVRAQAVNNFVNWACGECETESEEWLCLKEIEYAKQLRQQSQEGKNG